MRSKGMELSAFAVRQEVSLKSRIIVWSIVGVLVAAPSSSFL